MNPTPMLYAVDVNAFNYEQKERFYKLKDAIHATLSSRVEGYDDLADLMQDLDTDEGIEAREEVRCLGIASVDRFLKSTAMADLVAFKDVGTRTVYKAKKIHGRNAHIVDQQQESQRAKELKMQKELRRAQRDGREPNLNGRNINGYHSSASTSNGGYPSPPFRGRTRGFPRPPQPSHSFAGSGNDTTDVSTSETADESSHRAPRLARYTEAQYENSLTNPSRVEVQNIAWSDEDFARVDQETNFDAPPSTSRIPPRVPSAASSGSRAASVVPTTSTLVSPSRFRKKMSEDQMADFEAKMASAINGMLKLRHPSTFLVDDLMDLLDACDDRCRSYFAQTGRNLEDVVNCYCPSVEIGFFGGNTHVSWKPSEE
ncbi:hypothetical protein AAVH_22357 [Aphelenchoides avenae]|nr:hypothetical protein AAVH_22357 [Aphelenchus avenae]